MNRILITGATGNIGRQVIRFLLVQNADIEVVAGVRNINLAESVFPAHPQLRFTTFDFEDARTHATALRDIDTVFLLRPPHLAQVNRYFKPLIERIRALGIQRILFLSVQGAEKSRVIPHHRIENLIREAGLRFIFIRPSYFMQNLTTTLMEDIRTRREIILPAGDAEFNWVDVDNIGEVAAILITRFERFEGKIFEVTGSETVSFGDVTRIINARSGAEIKYRNVSPIRYFLIKKRQGVPTALILVMIALHYFPRFVKPPVKSATYGELTGKPPTLLKDFVEREKDRFRPVQ